MKSITGIISFLDFLNLIFKPCVSGTPKRCYEAMQLRYLLANDISLTREFDPHSGRRVVSLSKIHLPPPKSTGNTQEAVAPSRHD